MDMLPARKPLKILVFGAGAIGTYLGGSLGLAGVRTVFLERPEIAAELRTRGLRLRRGGQEEQLTETVFCGSIEEALALRPFDAALLATKSFDTPALVDSLRPYAADLPPVVCFQNGVENEAVIAAGLGNDKVIAGTVTSAVGRRGPGDIVLERFRGTGLAGTHPLVPVLADAFTRARLNPRVYPGGALAARGMKWSKMLTNLIANASAAILNMTPAEVFAHPGLFRMEMAMLQETLRVMAAQHIPVYDLPGTPVKLLAFAARSLPPWLAQPLLLRSVGKGRGAKMPSFHIDLHHGRGRSEVDFLNGAVVRAGAQTHVPTPVNRVLNETLLALTAGQIDLAAFDHQPEKLLAAVPAFTKP